MSAFIGSLKSHGNDIVEVWCSIGGIELRLISSKLEECNLDPIVARNFAALLVRASEEVERMRNRPQVPA